MNTQRKERDSNLELYRIIVMMLIVAHHYVVNSGLTDDTGPIFSNILSPQSIFLLLFGAWGKTGINCFVLITGYFMCKKNITLKKFVKLLFEVMFYKIVISGIFWITGYSSFTIKDFVKLLIPIQYVHTNFFETYLLFFLTIPFLNILIRNLTEKQHIRLLCLVTFIYVFFETTPYFYVNMNYVSWFIVLYFIASYIRFYPKKIYNNKKFWGIVTSLSILLSITSVLCLAFVYGELQKSPYYFVTDSNTFLAVLTAVSSFMFFKNLNLGQNKIINTISASTFGVLLIHANSDTMRQWLWKDTLNNVSMYYSPYGWLFAILLVIGIYIICTLIDLIRIKLIENPFFKLWDKFEPKLISSFYTIENKLFKRISQNDQQ